MKITRHICGLLALLLCWAGPYAMALAEGADEVDALIEWWRLQREALGQGWALNPDEPFGSTPTADEVGKEAALRLAVEAILAETEVTISDLKNHHLNFFFIDNVDGAFTTPVDANQRAWYFSISNRDVENRSERGFFVVVDGLAGEVTKVLSRGEDTTRMLFP